MKAIDWSNPEDMERFSANMLKEDDRGLIILCAGAIEATLEQHLLQHMPHISADERDHLFGYSGPIGTFSWRIKIAHAMGLISKQTMQKIDIVREMRNTAAHSYDKMHFCLGPIHQAVEWLISDLRFAKPDAINDDIRKTFILVSLLLMATIKLGSINEAHEKIIEMMERVTNTSPQKPIGT